MKYFKPIIIFSCIIALFGCGGGNKQKFSYKLIPVEANGQWGYIDNTGKYVITPQFKDAYLFSDGIALVQSTDEKFGYIGEDGKYIIKPEYFSGTSFTDGCAFVTPPGGFPFCIDKTGKTKFTLSNVYLAAAFNNGLSYVSISNKYGFVDKGGKVVIPAQYDNARSFSSGLAPVAKRQKNGNYKWGFVDGDGKMAIGLQFDDANSFSDDLALVVSGGKGGYINTKGEYVINPQFEYAEDFSEDMAAVRVNEKIGFIDKSGKMVINPQFDATGNFSEGVAAVAVGKDNWGFIDKTGKYVINPQFNGASNFYGDFAFAAMGGKAGLINKQGKYIVNPQFDDCFANFVPRSNIFFNGPRSGFATSDYYIINYMATQFLEGYYHLDYDYCREFGTEETVKTVDMLKQLSVSFFPDSLKRAAKDIVVNINGLKKEGDKATVTYNTSNVPTDQVLRLVKDDGTWKVQWTKKDMGTDGAATGADQALLPPAAAPTH